MSESKPWWRFVLVLLAPFAFGPSYESVWRPNTIWWRDRKGPGSDDE
jgi:hypothetical protein